MARHRRRDPVTPVEYEHWRKSCAGKIGYQSRHVAERIVKEQQPFAGVWPLSAYRCKWCRVRWHIGHHPLRLVG